MPDLKALLERVEQASGASWEIDCLIQSALDTGSAAPPTRPRYTASLDAALALVARIRPDWCWRVQKQGDIAKLVGEGPFWATCGSAGEQESVFGPTPALALLAALLKSMIAESDDATS